MKIVAHPTHIEMLRKRINAGEFDDQRRGIFDSFELVANPLIPIDKPNGKFRLADGTFVDRADFRMSTRFVEYGPEDVDWLVYCGLVVEGREANFYIMRQPDWRFMMDFMPIEPMRFIHLTSI